MKFGYARVSTQLQNDARQVEALTDQGITPDHIFIDKESGSIRERPALSELMIKLRDGDEVAVVSMDRLARSLADLHSLVEEITSKGAKLLFLKEGQSYSSGKNDPMATLMLGVLGAVAQFEREIIKQRQAEGISAAKARGVYTGRKPSIDRDKIAELLASGMNKSAIARELGINRASVFRIEKELDGQAKSSDLLS
ncbi:Site-specific DNA recombinase [Pseudovibrio denitrificans]|uniref:Site-specific DNA recombinase n=1 Tax=Pseudovibrio denitrificans TaxID=258256 RepID=A0A1I7DP38_9HYPH|nr:recombinase family protein [Pseudovibrio denitrificans]SFU13449.1 Site-specific DNA recombinase [Pseudovibrio denitrificans]